MTAVTSFPRPIQFDFKTVADTADLPMSGAAVGQPIYATIRETGDAEASYYTDYSMATGDTFLGNVSYDGDIDVVRIQLQAGRKYVFDVQGTGLADTAVGLFDRYGNPLRVNDDFGSPNHSRLEMSVATDGVYLLGVAGQNGATGSYTLTAADAGVSPGLLPYTMPQIARQLTDGYWNSIGGGRRTFDVEPGGTLTVDMSQLNPEGQKLARMALDAWSQVTGIKFDTTSRAGSNADIRIDDSDNDGAYCQHTLSGSTIDHAYVNIPLSWHDSPGEGFSSYEYQTFLHELGHALGLGHAGNYNGSATYGVDNLYANDSWQATVMSYFSQDENSAVDASYAFAITPMIADILAIQQLYGAPRNFEGGATVWGVNGTVGGGLGKAMEMLTTGEEVTMTVFDQGGVDWLNLSNDSTDQRIVMSQGGVSDVYGRDGNLSIALGTIIENVKCGTGNDIVFGNAADNFIWGNLGNDTLRGGGGNDTLQGGIGTDRLIGGAGNDVYLVDALDTMIETAGGGIDHVRAWSSRALGAHLENLTLENVAGARNGTGNNLANVIAGNSFGNYLVGNGGNDTLNGFAGDDTLVGGAGADRLVGGVGDDLYFVDALDTVIETAGAGVDMVVASVNHVLGAHVENLKLADGAGALRGQGNGLDNNIQGNEGANHLSGLGGNDMLIGDAGNDTLQGGAGADSMVGGTGNDIYLADALDTIVELVDGGIDQVRCWVNYRLGDNLEALLLGDARTARYGTGNNDHNTVVGGRYDNYLSGLDGNDTMFGMDGNDTLDGNIGSDRLIGGTGDDLYIVDGFDTVVEHAGGGIDTVQSQVTVALSNHVENATLTGTRDADILGNYLDNVLTGNDGANVITSAGGTDEMWGLGGADAFVFAMGQGGRIGDFQDDVDVLRIDVDESRGLTVDDIIATGRNTDTGCELVLDDVVLRIDQINLDALRDDLVLI